MGRMRLRVILDRTQKHLAIVAGLKPKRHSLSSYDWRDALGPECETEKQMRKARDLLAGCELDEATRKLVDSDDALSTFRSFGDWGATQHLWSGATMSIKGYWTVYFLGCCESILLQGWGFSYPACVALSLRYAIILDHFWWLTTELVGT